MAPYVKLTRADGAELHMPVPFAFSGRSDGETIVYLVAGNGLPVKETLDQICALLGIGRHDTDFAEVGEHPSDLQKLIAIKRAARAVVDERYGGTDWEELKKRIAELAELTGGGS